MNTGSIFILFDENSIKEKFSCFRVVAFEMKRLRTSEVRIAGLGVASRSDVDAVAKHDRRRPSKSLGWRVPNDIFLVAPFPRSSGDGDRTILIGASELGPILPVRLVSDEPQTSPQYQRDPPLIRPRQKGVQSMS